MEKNLLNGYENGYFCKTTDIYKTLHEERKINWVAS